jgi:integrase
MDSSIRTGSPLRQRMIEDMRMRKLEHKTQEAYIRAVRKLAAFLRRSPDTATVEDLRRFQLHLVDQGTSPITLNATLTGLKFFFDVTLDRGELMAKMQPVRVPRTLPVVLSREEVARLIAAAPNLKSQTALSIAYGAGLRASEVIALRVGDIDSQRMSLRVEQAKVARTATPCSHRCCSSGCARGGAWAMPKARFCPAGGSSQVSIRWIRSPPGSSTAPSMPPPARRESTSACRCTRCVTASPLTCWSARSTSA